MIQCERKDEPRMQQRSCTNLERRMQINDLANVDRVNHCQVMQKVESQVMFKESSNLNFYIYLFYLFLFKNNDTFLK